MKFKTDINDHTHEVTLNPETSEFTVGDQRKSYHFHTQNNGRKLLRIGTALYKIDDVSFDNQTVEFTLNGRWCRVDVRDERDLLLDEMGFKSAAEIGEGELKAPMPGKILEIMVDEGDTVELGDPVAILEAMKMENELKAPVAGQIASVSVTVGDSLEKNTVILEIESDG